MGHLQIPVNYKDVLGSQEVTEKAIKMVKDMFQTNLAAQLSLLRVTAPMIVMKGTGLNDELSGVERPVSFPIKDLDDAGAEVVHSLAKWKRVKLGQMGTAPGRGIYTDMNALRPDESLDNLHSIYVDQWDWEQVIDESQRNLDHLKRTVRRIYEAIKVTENLIYVEFPEIKPILPDEIFFINSEELLQMYPGLSAKERENRIAREHRAVFVIGIGAPLSDGRSHDSRAADYDDWSSPNSDGYTGLNGDLIVWNPVLECAFELSSMGIRVNPQSLEYQLDATGNGHKRSLMFHSMLLGGRLPQTIGGGIGQSRLCMFLLRKAHIGEIQCSIWPEEMRNECAAAGINLV